MKYTICENHTTVHGLLIQTLLVHLKLESKWTQGREVAQIQSTNCASKGTHGREVSRLLPPQFPLPGEDKRQGMLHGVLSKAKLANNIPKRYLIKT